MGMRNPHDPRKELWETAMRFMKEANESGSAIMKDNAAQYLDQYFSVVDKGVSDRVRE